MSTMNFTVANELLIYDINAVIKKLGGLCMSPLSAVVIEKVLAEYIAKIENMKKEGK